MKEHGVFNNLEALQHHLSVEYEVANCTAQIRQGGREGAIRRTRCQRRSEGTV